ncbi:hypothetical protein, partial [Burkholderia sp. SIMBA_062]|uniref:hypothetical protein n=1 Tax=Burkholderia sp. SIMBA_062 TaxID=3085803 RepID=UPI00397A0D99
QTQRVGPLLDALPQPLTLRMHEIRRLLCRGPRGIDRCAIRRRGRLMIRHCIDGAYVHPRRHPGQTLRERMLQLAQGRITLA